MGNIVTLLSDWRLRDPYVAMLKGQILSNQQDTYIVDITHYADKFDILQTSILMKGCYSSFPENTIHLILTNTSFNSTYQPVLFSYKNHHFIGEDNGLFFLMFGQETPLQGLTLKETSGNSIKDIIELILCINKGNVAQKTTDYSTFKRMFVENPDISEQSRQIEGKIIYVDAFNNAITDIPSNIFKNIVGDGPFEATIQSAGVWNINKFAPKYENLQNEMFLTENGLGFIEIASYQSDVAILADLSVFDKVIIKY